MTDSTASRSRRRPAFLGMLAFVILALSGGLVAACSAGANPTEMASMPAPEASEAPAMTMSAALPSGAGADTSAIEVAWAARPEYVREAADTVQEAYHYALERPDVIRWMPCYCGCMAMEHRSNLDCFLRARMAAGAVVFEEHASFCDVCVQTALLAKQRLAEGRSLAEIRAEVDATFGGKGAPGTPTDLPKG